MFVRSRERIRLYLLRTDPIAWTLWRDGELPPGGDITMLDIHSHIWHIDGNHKLLRY